MKIIAIVGLVLLVPVALFACPKGEHEDSGACAYDTSASAADSSKWVSDEKPPKTTTGEWQTGKFKVILIPSQDGKTEVADQVHFAQVRDGKSGN